MTYPKRSIASLTLRGIGWMFAVFLVIGLVIAIPAGVKFAQAWRLQAHGIDVEGRVTKLGVSTRNCGNNDNDGCTDYNVDFTYDAGGVQVAHEAVTQGLYDGLVEGGPIAVRYVAGEPSLYEVDGGWTFFGGLIFAVFALVFGLVGFFGLRWRWRIARRLVRLRETGVVRRAEVTGRQITGMKVNNRALWYATWKDETGLVGRTEAQNPDLLPKLGDRISVYADPVEDLGAAWEGDAGTR